jgi:seryl-tRNA(Sec) selenium transferase
MNEIANLAGTLKTYLSKNHDDTIILPVELIEQVTEELERQQQEILKVVEDYDTLIEVAHKMKARSRAIENAAGTAVEYHMVGCNAANLFDTNVMDHLMQKLGKVLNGEETPL